MPWDMYRRGQMDRLRVDSPTLIVSWTPHVTKPIMRGRPGWAFAVICINAALVSACFVL
jgi:hypothetical protein